MVFEAETGALIALNKLESKHIIECFTAFTKGTTRCMVLEWADGGNLRDLWTSERTPSLCADNVKEVVEQIAGIACITT